MGVRKNIYFSDEEYQRLEDIKTMYGLKSDSAAMRFLMQKEDLSDQIAKKLVNQLEENYMRSDRLKWGVKTAEQNSVLLLDAINTILYALKLNDLIPVDEQENPLIQKSRMRLDRKIEKRKQRRKKY